MSLHIPGVDGECTTGEIIKERVDIYRATVDSSAWR